MTKKNIFFTSILSIFSFLVFSCSRDIEKDISSIKSTVKPTIDDSVSKKDDDKKSEQKEDKDNGTENTNNESKIKRPFVFVWRVGADGSFSIPMNGQFINDYKFDLKWSRVDDPKIHGKILKLDGTATKRYNELLYQKEIEGLPGAGEYIMEITGIFPAFRFGNSLTATKADDIIEIRQWGDIEWETMEKAFSSCKNLRLTAEDAPNLSKVSDMSYMFYKASSLNSSINHWDVSKITNMSHMFEKAKSFNQPLDKWNVGNVTNMNNMFKEAESFSQNIENWDVSKVTDMEGMFYAAQTFDEPLDKWNVSNVTNMSGMFEKAEIFNQSLNSWTINNKADLSRMFVGAGYFDKNNIIKWNISGKNMY